MLYEFYMRISSVIRDIIEKLTVSQHKKRVRKYKLPKHRLFLPYSLLCFTGPDSQKALNKYLVNILE